MAASVVSRVAEGFQAELMTDNRVAARHGELWAAATKELKYVVDLPDHLWCKLAQVSDGLTATQLKDRVIRGAHVSYHFLWRRVLKPAGGLPWRLVRGNVDENLDWLAAQPAAPSEPCSKNMWYLLQNDRLPRAHLKAVVSLLGECSWSSMPAEQQHASVALLHRWHPEYGVEQLVSRAILHQTVRLLPHMRKGEKQLVKLVRKMQQVDARQPQKVSGSHMLVQALVYVAKGRTDVISRTCFMFVCARSPAVCGEWCMCVCASVCGIHIRGRYISRQGDVCIS